MHPLQKQQQMKLHSTISSVIMILIINHTTRIIKTYICEVNLYLGDSLSGMNYCTNVVMFIKCIFPQRHIVLTGLFSEFNVSLPNTKLVSTKIMLRWGAAQQNRKHSCFTPSGLGFVSWRSKDFFLVLHVVKVNQQCYCLEQWTAEA